MPLREYCCDECLECTEIFFSTTEHQPENVKCEVCGGVAVRIAVSPSSFVLRGGGWGDNGYVKGSKSD